MAAPTKGEQAKTDKGREHRNAAAQGGPMRWPLEGDWERKKQTVVVKKGQDGT